MGVMTATEAPPVPDQAFTVDDLARTPDDGRRYELVDGTLIVSAAPGIPHQHVLGELHFELRLVCPRGLQVLLGPAVRMSLDTELIPDIVVVRAAQLRGVRLTAPPLLAVEVQSPSTKTVDRTLKKVVYERFGIQSYWLVVPSRKRPAVIAYELREGQYEQVAQATRDEPFRALLPFPVEMVPSRLVAQLLPTEQS